MAGCSAANFVSSRTSIPVFTVPFRTASLRAALCISLYPVMVATRIFSASAGSSASAAATAVATFVRSATALPFSLGG